MEPAKIQHVMEPAKVQTHAEPIYHGNYCDTYNPVPYDHATGVIAQPNIEYGQPIMQPMMIMPTVIVGPTLSAINPLVHVPLIYFLQA